MKARTEVPYDIIANTEAFLVDDERSKSFVQMFFEIRNKKPRLEELKKKALKSPANGITLILNAMLDCYQQLNDAINQTIIIAKELPDGSISIFDVESGLSVARYEEQALNKLLTMVVNKFERLVLEKENSSQTINRQIRISVHNITAMLNQFKLKYESKNTSIKLSKGNYYTWCEEKKRISFFSDYRMREPSQLDFFATDTALSQFTLWNKVYLHATAASTLPNVSAQSQTSTLADENVDGVRP